MSQEKSGTGRGAGPRRRPRRLADATGRTRLRELAKMDGAVVCDAGAERILRAAVQRVRFHEPLEGSRVPVNPAGKVDKKSLRAPFWAGRDRQVG